MSEPIEESEQREQSTNEIADPQLRLLVEKGRPDSDYSDLVRAAFVLLERRIREAAGLVEHDFGKDLIDKAFHPENGLLQPVSPVAAERAGLHHLLVGILLYYRNPVAHRPINYTRQVAGRVLSLIDHALQLVDQAVQSAFHLGDFVGPHEGQILRRRDFRVDIDGDGEREVVVLLELGPCSDGDCLAGHLAPVILKRVDKEYRRIPTESVAGQTIYGAVGVEIRNVTGLERPDVVVSWSWGETQTLTLILRHEGGQYVLARRELTTGTTEPYFGPTEKGFFVHMRQLLEFADVDGDGIVEMIQTLHFDMEELEGLGYGSLTPDDHLPLVCRLLKWDTEKQRIVQLEQRLIITRRTPLPDYA